MDLKKWMADHYVSADDVAGVLGIDPSTVFNWRSAGIPKSRLKWVTKTLNEWLERSAAPQSLRIEFSTEDFDLINRAAMARGQTMREYCLESLINQAALESRQKVTYKSNRTIKPELNEKP